MSERPAPARRSCENTKTSESANVFLSRKREGSESAKGAGMGSDSAGQNGPLPAGFRLLRSVRVFASKNLRVFADFRAFAVPSDFTLSRFLSVPRKPWRIAGVRPRVAGLILATQAVLLWWVADSEIARSVYLICYSLMMPTVLFLLFARLLHRWLALERHELLLGYIVLTATIPIVGFGGLRF